MQNVNKSGFKDLLNTKINSFDNTSRSGSLSALARNDPKRFEVAADTWKKSMISMKQEQVQRIPSWRWWWRRWHCRSPSTSPDPLTWKRWPVYNFSIREQLETYGSRSRLSSSPLLSPTPVWIDYIQTPLKSEAYLVGPIVLPSPRTLTQNHPPSCELQRWLLKAKANPTCDPMPALQLGEGLPQDFRGQATQILPEISAEL